ncbi:MAG: putative DNA binding domain-containing protein [Chloroflexi bacterium]|nr:putative DNA binding domain-containing protein [Chloroflexota bacterium]OJV92760.1 MAG: hypothetical protein BGO39_29795 [Chloroflexi bacterium 54-19]
MLDIKTFRELLEGGETQTVEFKIQPPRLGEIAERLCGFANTPHGGMVIIGVKNGTWEITGVKNVSEAVDSLLKAARLCKPPVPMVEAYPQILDLAGKKVVIAQVPGNRGELYQAGGSFLIRKGTETVPMSVEEVEIFLYKTGQLNWEARPNLLSTLEDLDEAKVEEYLKQYERLTGHRNRLPDKWERLTKMQCLAPLTGQTAPGPVETSLRPTNAGLLLFGISPRDFFSGAEIVATYYRDNSGVQRYTDRQIITGTLPEQIELAEAFFQKHIQVGARIEGFKRIEEPEYSLEALREALVNAAVHRDYSLQGEAVRVFFYTDRIEIHSPGTLPPGIDLDMLRQGLTRSRPRNQIIASVMRDMPGHYMERIGSGIRFMLNQSEALELPLPEFKEQGGEFVVTFFKREINQEPLNITRSQSELPTYFRPPAEAPVTTPSHPRPEPLVAPSTLNRIQRQELALNYVREHGAITNYQYRLLAGVSENTALRDLDALVDQRSLRAVGKGRSRKYVL